MRVAIINVPTKVGPENWQACWQAAADQAPVFGMNEALTAKARALYRSLAKEHDMGRTGLGRGPNPIFWDRKRFRGTNGQRHLLHVRGSGVLAARYPGYNAARYVQEVTLTPRHGRDPMPFAVLNTHWVPNGRKVPAAWRTWARREAMRGVRAIAKGHLDEGRPVWFIGDTNIGGPFGFRIRGARFVWLRAHGIDKVGLWVPKGFQVEPQPPIVFPAPTDHRHGVVGRARIVRP